MDAKYEPAALEDVVEQCTRLNESEKNKLLDLLQRYEPLFNGTLGTFTGDQYGTDLKPDAQPHHARPYPVPKAYKRTLKLEIQHLIKAGVLREINRSQWVAPTSIIPKKDGSVRIISNFRDLNERITRRPCPLPRMQDLLLKLEGSTCGTFLDLTHGMLSH